MGIGLKAHGCGNYITKWGWKSQAMTLFRKPVDRGESVDGGPLTGVEKKDLMD